MAPHRLILSGQYPSDGPPGHDSYFSPPPPPPRSSPPLPPPSLPPRPLLPPLLPPLPVGPDRIHSHRLINILILTASLVATVFLLTLILSLVLLRRRRRRRFLHAASPPNDDGADAFGGDGDGDGDDDEDIHHVWYIRTVGLDEATIESIAVAEYRVGAGLLGAADCSVCLGEFHDGEHVRLLPKCGHAFHVSCIDTWLRAHVNCPLCRALIADSAAAGEVSVEPSRSGPVEEPESSSISSLSEGGGEEEEAEIGHGLELVVDQLASPNSPSEEGSTSDTGSIRLHCVRRWASMDLPSVRVSGASTETEGSRRWNGKETASQEEQSHKEKQGNPSCKDPNFAHFDHSDVERSSSGSGRGSFFFSRHSRARSSVLPL